jgi:hypothetical protein
VIKGDKVEVIATKYHRDFLGFWYYVRQEKDDILLAKYREDALEDEYHLAMHFSRVKSIQENAK